MNNSPHLLILQLIVQGKSKNYISKFEEGLNLIWGDLDSGKSSILNLIDYCLGGKNETLLYEEMLSQGRTATLEVDLNGRIYTLERDIFSADAPIRVHAGTFEVRGNKYPMLMSASPSGEMPDGWISDFILDCLGIPKIKVKESRTREGAESDRLSFRDLMKLLYLKQTRIGSDALLDYQNGPVFSKNVEIQKFVFNIYDDRLAELRSELTKHSKELSELERAEYAVKKFLKDVSISVENLIEIDQNVENHESTISEIQDAIERLKSDFVLSTDVGMEISKSVENLRKKLQLLDEQININDTKYENFVKLSNTYRYDLQALTVSQISRAMFNPSHAHLDAVACPLCDSALVIDSPVVNDKDLEQLSKSLKNRDSGIRKLLEQLRADQNQALVEKERLTVTLKDALRSFDENNITKISPLIASIQAMEMTKSAVMIELSHAERNSAITHRFEDIGTKLDTKKGTISNIRRAIKSVEEGLIGLDEVIAKLTLLLKQTMEKSGLQKVHNVYFDKRFIAYFRNISYYLSSSGGVRTITSIATYTSRLQYLLETPCNLPTFLMIDTPGQNIGRYRAVDDASEVSDPSLYENIFKRIISVTDHAKTKGMKSQVIVVDNDLPECLKEGVNFHLVKRFSKMGGAFDKGLINNL